MTKNNKERFNQEERRTYPCYLTGSEYERERRRLDDMVDGFLKWNPIEKVGETENFIIEIDLNQRMVLLKEKSIVVDCPFKLSMKSDEIKDIIKQLTKGIKRLAHNESRFNKKIKSYSVEEIRRNYPKAYAKWTTEEDQQLITEYKEGIPISKIANIHQRKKGAIYSRLKKIGLVQE